MRVRSYQTADAETLWEMKQAFETGLGEAGGDEKATRYDEKLTDEYRTRWLGWVEECVAENRRTVLLGEVETDEEPVVAGYVFLLPESLAFIWDAAVLNELFVWPRFRGTGLADELVAEATAVAREQSLPLDRLVLDVDRENERAQAFYDRHGFEHWGEMVARPLDEQSAADGEGAGGDGDGSDRAGGDGGDSDRAGGDGDDSDRAGGDRETDGDFDGESDAPRDWVGR